MASGAPSLLVAPGVAARQLGRGDRALRAGARDPGRASLRDAGRGAEVARAGQLADVDLVITSYGTLLRLPWLAATALAISSILDEAQAIKNPGAKQTRASRSSRRARASR